MTGVNGDAQTGAWTRRLLALVALTALIAGIGMLRPMRTASAAAAPWSASYNISTAPASVAQGASIPFTVTLTNTGSQTWKAAGTSPVHLEVHFAATAGQPQAQWWSDQRITLAHDVAPRTSITLAVTVAAPTNNAGAAVVVFQMVKEPTTWFAQSKSIPITITATTPPAAPLSASYDLSTAPVTFVQGVPTTFNVTLTNTGSQTWTAGGANPVDMSVHFAAAAGQPQAQWWSDQRITLALDVAPGTSTTVVVTATAPAGHTGPAVVEFQMVQEPATWFAQSKSIPVTIASPPITGNPPISSLTDDFTGTALDTTKWQAGTNTTLPSPPVSVDGQLHISTFTGNGYSFITSKNLYSLRGSSVTTELVSAGDQTISSAQIFPMEVVTQAGLYDSPGTDQGWQIMINQGSFAALQRRDIVLGGWHHYDPVADRYFRISESGGTIHFATSPDGVTWSEFYSYANPGVDIDNMVIRLTAGNWNTETRTTTAVFGDVNITPAQP